jgi:7-carboxy-7-deazaguanine synthase
MISLRITEIFYSIQGESNTVGFPTIFVRLTGCPLRCQYCDTAYAFKGGEQMTAEQILEAMKPYATRYVTVTGGEPLAQPGCYPLLTQLCDAGYSVSLETSGALPIAKVDPRVSIVLDLKTPGSHEVNKNLWENLQHLKATDQVKFVICDSADFLWAQQQMEQYDLSNRCTVLFSPSYEQVTLIQLAEWILEKQLPVRMQSQLHKYIWGDVQGK